MATAITRRPMRLEVPAVVQSLAVSFVSTVFDSSSTRPSLRMMNVHHDAEIATQYERTKSIDGMELERRQNRQQ
jgi:hypothetical protein